MEAVEYRFELTSRTAILFHADDIEENDRLKEWRDDPKNRPLFVPGDDRTPPWSWQTYLYFNPADGCLAIPQEVIMRCLGVAAAKVTLKGMTTFKGLSQCGMYLDSEFVKFTTGGKQIKKSAIVGMEDNPFKAQADKVMKLGGKLFLKRVKPPGSKSKHVRVRLRIDSWKVEGVIAVTEEAITPEILQTIFGIAGKRAGLLDWRPSAPSNPGPFGQFTAQLTPLGVPVG